MTESDSVRKNYGWLRDPPDFRDLPLPMLAYPVALPPKVDLRKYMPDVYDQGAIGSCTANAAAAAMVYTQGVQVKHRMKPSRLFVYYNARLLGNLPTNADTGAYIRDAIKSLNKFGIASEVLQPYKTDKFTEAPSERAYKNGLLPQHVVLEYRSVPQNLQSMKLALSQGMPIVVGFSVFESFEYGNWKNVAPMPAPTERFFGGHAVLVVGYDDRKDAFIVRNSWGKNWKLKGYWYMPYAYLVDPKLAGDFWVITKVGRTQPK